MKIRSIIWRLLLLVSLTIIFNKSSIAGNNTWTTDGPYGASVKSIAIHPFYHNIILIGTIQNGVYKSSDAGESWRHIDSVVLPRNQREIVFHPTAPDTVYAAAVGGIFRSNDCGEIWVDISPSGRSGQEFRAIVLDPINPSVVITGGVWDRWKSTDGGLTWTEFWIEPGGGIDHEVDALSIDPVNTNILYVVTGDAETAAGIFKSTNQGETWFNIHSNSDSSGAGTDVTIDPVNPEIIYYSRFDQDRVSGRFLSKSTNGGASWFDISPRGLSQWGVDAVRVSPFDHNIVYIATLRDGFYVSTDGGSTWTERNNGLGRPNTVTIEIDNQNGHLYLGIYYDGIYKSTNGGESWRGISQNLLGMNGSVFAFRVDSSFSAIVAIGRILYHQEQEEAGWQSIPIDMPFSNTAGAIQADKYWPGYIYLASLSSNFFLSTDGGATWEERSNGLPLGQQLSGMAVSYSNNGARRIFLASTGIFRSDDLGQSWQLCQGGLPSQFFLNVYAAQSDPDIIAATDFAGRIYISIDRGNNWIEATRLPRLEDAWIDDLHFDPNDANHIFATPFGYGLFESTNLGQSWTNITNNLPLYPNYSSVFGPAINPLDAQNMFVVSSKRGIYQTHNGGQHWESFNTGLDTTFPGGYIFLAPNDTTRLFYATFSHSVWSIHRTVTGVEDEGPERPGELGLSAYPNPFNATTRIKYELPSSGNVTLEIYDILGRKAAVLLETEMPAGRHSLAWDAGAYPSGVYFARLTVQDNSRAIKMVLLK